MSEIKAGDAVRYLDDDSTLTKGGLYKVSAVKDNMNVGYPQMVFLEGLGGGDFWFDYRFEVVPTFPDSFSFTHDTTTQRYNLTRVAHSPNVWECYQDGDDERFPAKATYTAEEIAEHFAKGHWREVSFSEPIKVADHPVEEILEVRIDGVVQEPEMKFPFTFKLSRGRSGTLFTACPPESGYVAVTWGDDTRHGTWYSLGVVKKFVEDGNWLVKSVGPQTAPDAPTEPSKELTPLSIKLDGSDVVDATERLERLAQAIEDVNIAMESFQKVFADVQGMLGGKSAVKGYVSLNSDEGI